MGNYSDGLDVEVGERKKSRLPLRSTYQSTVNRQNVVPSKYKRNEVLMHVTLWMNPGNIILNQKC